MAKLSRIKPEWLREYVAHRMTSTELAKLSGYAAPYLRKSIQRDPKPESKNAKWLAERKKLIITRRRFQDSISHLSTKEIMEQAKVSQSTAIRIKNRNKHAKV